MNFLPSSFVDPAEKYPAGLHLAKTIQNSIFVPELQRKIFEYSMELNQRRRDLGYDAIQRLFPLETVNIYCAPCPVAINTALSICQMNSCRELQYAIRVDPRIGATCCGRVDGHARIDAAQAVVDSVKLAEWNSPSTLTVEEKKRHGLILRSFDRSWIEKALYKATELWSVTNNWNWVLNPPAAEYLDYIHSDRFAVFLTEHSYATLVYDGFRLVKTQPGELYESRKIQHEMHFFYIGTWVWRGFEPN